MGYTKTRRCNKKRNNRKRKTRLIRGGTIGDLLRSYGATEDTRFQGIEVLPAWPAVADAAIGGRPDTVQSLAVVSPDRLAVGYYSANIVIRDTAGAAVQTLVGHTDIVNCLIKLPDGRLASGCEDRTIRIWNIGTGECTNVLQVGAEVHSLAVLRDGSLASSDEQGKLRIWDIRTGECTSTRVHPEGPVYSLAALPDGGIAAGCDNGDIVLWGPGGQRGRTLTLPFRARNAVNFGAHAARALTLLQSGRLAAGYGGDTRIRIWNVKSGVCEAVLTGHLGTVNALTTLPDGRLLSGSRDDGTIKLWDTVASPIRTVPVETPIPLTHPGINALVAWRDGSGRVASGGVDGTIHFWK